MGLRDTKPASEITPNARWWIWTNITHPDDVSFQSTYWVWDEGISYYTNIENDFDLLGSQFTPESMNIPGSRYMEVPDPRPGVDDEGTREEISGSRDSRIRSEAEGTIQT